MKADPKDDNEASMDMRSEKSNTSNKNKKISLMRNNLGPAVGVAGTKQ
jgi:hypothetical protein